MYYFILILLLSTIRSDTDKLMFFAVSLFLNKNPHDYVSLQEQNNESANRNKSSDQTSELFLLVISEDYKLWVSVKVFDLAGNKF